MSFVKGSHWANKIWSHVTHDFNLDSIQAHHFFCSEWELIPASQPQNILENGSNYGSSGVNTSHRVSLPYLVYRAAFMVILLSGITISASCQSHLFHIFLTNWSFTLQNVYGFLLFGNVLWRWWTFKQRQNDPQQKTSTSSSSLLTLGGSNHQAIILELQNGGNEKQQQQNGYQNLASQQENTATQPDIEKQRGSVMMGTNFCSEATPPELKSLPLTYVEKCIWILMNVVHVLPYCVVLGYWTVVYKYDPDQPACERFKSHYIVHGATAVLAIVDAFTIAIPARPTHFLIPTGLVLFYVVFTCLYEAAGGPYRPGNEFIYSVLNWKSNPKKAIIFSTLAVVVTPIAHTVFCYGVYKLRTCLKSLYIRNKYRWSNSSERPN